MIAADQLTQFVNRSFEPLVAKLPWAFHVKYIAWFNRLKRLSAGWNETCQLMQANRCRKDANNRYSASCEVLLISKVCVQRHKYFKSCFRKAQKLAIRFSGPSRFLNRKTFVAMRREAELQSSRCTLVNQYLHFRRLLSQVGDKA